MEGGEEEALFTRYVPPNSFRGLRPPILQILSYMYSPAYTIKRYEPYGE